MRTSATCTCPARIIPRQPVHHQLAPVAALIQHPRSKRGQLKSGRSRRSCAPKIVVCVRCVRFGANVRRRGRLPIGETQNTKKTWAKVGMAKQGGATRQQKISGRVLLEVREPHGAEGRLQFTGNFSLFSGSLVFVSISNRMHFDARRPCGQAVVTVVFPSLPPSTCLLL